ncbi:Hsp20 family protein [Rubrobacter tropicus]|uniref:Hsp20 family protein n=1 Tax=Rubrobacter tropicus TaxID=2653851 RepID=A0A6G8Q615_9ACTN|nr:Hsp20/alpha crystallin family protein [Rubrobacter tropicus]QIN81934.1 Hsp20 family protein [Rubrobacter tropicus]
MSEQRRNPFRGFLDMASEMNRMRYIGSYGQDSGQEDRERTHATAWVPTADVFARGRDLVIRMELAGVAPQDIDVSFHENTLTVSGERGRDVDEVSFYVHERFYGVFRRSMTLPAGVDEDDITAEFDNGLVEITVKGGAVSSEPRRIEVRNRAG